MMVPIWMLVVLVLLAAPTCILLTTMLREWAAARGLRLIGVEERIVPGDYAVRRWCLLYVPLWTTRHGINTLLLD